MRLSKIVYSWPVVFLYTLFLLFLSLMPTKNVSLGQVTYFDKVAHTIAYVILSFLLYTTLLRRKNPQAFLVSLVYAATLGCAIEFLQKLVPYRSFEILDMAANFFGSVFGVFVVKLKHKLTVS